MKRVIYHDRLIALCLIILSLGVQAGIWVLRVGNTPQGHDMIPIHNSLSDYPLYVSIIRQGLSGEFFVSDRFAVEPHEGSPVHLFYLLLGWIGKLFVFNDAHLVYHVARFTLGFLWGFTLYRLVSVVSTDRWVRRLGLFFALFSASFPRMIFAKESYSVGWYMTWWSELDPLLRSAFVPHFMLGHIMMAASVISIIRFLQFPNASKGTQKNVNVPSKSGKRYLVRAAVASWIAAFVHPPSALLLLAIALSLVIMYRTKRMAVVTTTVSLACLFGLLVIDNATSVFPWDLPRSFEGWSFALSVWEYILALGPSVLLAIGGIILGFFQHAFPGYPHKAIVSKTGDIDTRTFVSFDSISYTLLLLWIVFSIVMIPVSYYLPIPISNIRFLQVAVWVPIAIFAAWAMSWVYTKVGRRIAIGILLFWCFLTFVGYPDAFRSHVQHIFFSKQYSYPNVGYLQAILELDRIVPYGANVLSLSLAGATIPMYVNRTSYVGQVVYTPKLQEKLTRSWKFFDGTLGSCQAYMLMKEHNIRAVLYSFDEKNAGNALLFYPFLQPWNTYGDTSIFTFVDVAPSSCGG